MSLHVKVVTAVCVPTWILMLSAMSGQLGCMENPHSQEHLPDDVANSVSATTRDVAGGDISPTTRSAPISEDWYTVCHAWFEGADGDARFERVAFSICIHVTHGGRPSMDDLVSILGMPMVVTRDEHRTVWRYSYVLADPSFARQFVVTIARDGTITDAYFTDRATATTKMKRIPRPPDTSFPERPPWQAVWNRIVGLSTVAAPTTQTAR